MRQRVEVGLPVRQNTPAAHGGSPTSSDTSRTQVAFSQNQINALVLPLVSDTMKLIWVHANEINIPLDVAAQLDKTFDMFPYPTRKRTAALAKRWSLHPDQVRVWFMLQRLRYGISWDCADIPKVRKAIESSRGRGKPRKVRQRNDSLKSEEEEPDRKKARRVRDDQRTNEGRAEDVKVDELLEREIKAELLTQEERGGKGKTPRKRKRMTALREKRAGEDVVERAEDVGITGAEVAMASAESEPCRSARRRKQKDCAHPACVVGPGKAPGVNGDAGAEGKVEGEPRPVGAVAKSDGHCYQRTKTHRQLAMMKRAFVSCQYPDGEDYDRLRQLSGVSHYMLVQWFSDMRYYIKKKRPQWMNQEQHREALANVQYRQCLSALSRRVSDGKDEAQPVGELRRDSRT